MFFDSSALVKLYADEHDSRRVHELERSGPAVVSILARAEVPAALWRKVRTGELSMDDAALLTLAFEADWHGEPAHDGRFTVVALPTSVAADAATLCSRHPLTAYDAVQLASALAVHAEEPDLAFSTFERRLARAAGAEGLPTA